MDAIEHSHRETEGNLQTTTNHLADLLTRHTATDVRVRQTEEKLKADEQTVRDITARIALLPTSEDVASVRRDLNEKVCVVHSMFSASDLLFASTAFVVVHVSVLSLYASDSYRVAKRSSTTR